MKSKSPRRAIRHAERGQAVVLFLAVIAACCCVFALVYNVGQMTNQKEATINAADAAALSGALVEARMLNFEAYTNRAMVANEVTIAQLVSLDSFIQYSNEMFQYIAIYTAPIPYLDDLTQALADATQIAQDIAEPVIAAAVPVVDALVSALSGIQSAANGVGALAANEISDKIAKANETTFDGRDDDPPKLTAGLLAGAMNEDAWQAFTQANDGDGRAAGKGVVLNSRDPFSTNRPNGSFLNTVNDALELLGGGISYTVLDKTSGTTTLQDYDHWIAQDSLDLASGGVQTCFGIPCGYGTEVDPFSPPLAYGRADADSDGNTDHNLCNASGFLGAPTVNCQLAQDNAITLSYNGLPTFRDLAGDLSKTGPCSTNNGSDSPSLPYVMAVQKAGSATLSTQNLGVNDVPVPGPQGSPDLTDNLQNGGNLTSISAACVFFFRPDGAANDVTGRALARHDAQHEFASLYNPYWQARLSTADPKWTATLYAVIGHLGLDQALQ